jgi:hypothetical protein
VGHFSPGCFPYDRNHVISSERAFPLLRVVIEVNGRETFGQTIDVPHANQLFAQEITPLFSRERVIHERFEVSAGIFLPMLRPPFIDFLKAVETGVQLQFGLVYGRFAN